MHVVVEDVCVATSNVGFAAFCLETGDQFDSVLVRIFGTTAADGVKSVANRRDNSMHVKCFDHGREPVSHAAAPLTAKSWCCAQHW